MGFRANYYMYYIVLATCMNNVSMIHDEPHVSDMICKSPTVQRVLWSIPGLVNCTGGDGEMGTAVSCKKDSQVAGIIL